MRRIIQEPFLSALMQNGKVMPLSFWMLILNQYAKVMVGECEKEVGIYATYIGGADRPYGKVYSQFGDSRLD